MADEVVGRLRRRGVEATVVADRRIVRLEGRPRVEAAWVADTDGKRERIDADAVILARGRVPYRNVDGAVLPAAGVVFAQPGTEPQDGPDIERAGRAAAAQALEAARAPRTAAEPPLRIGGPR
jgi:hypothetical protein